VDSGVDLVGLDMAYSIHNAVLYNSAHSRVKDLWGSASQYRCVKCPEQAIDWAYDGTDLTQLTSSSGDYSRYPEFYMPMCRRCHRFADRVEKQLAVLARLKERWENRL
jgi:hypothetical protein